MRSEAAVGPGLADGVTEFLVVITNDESVFFCYFALPVRPNPTACGDTQRKNQKMPFEFASSEHFQSLLDVLIQAQPPPPTQPPSENEPVELVPVDAPRSTRSSVTNNYHEFARTERRRMHYQHVSHRRRVQGRKHARRRRLRRAKEQERRAPKLDAHVSVFKQRQAKRNRAQALQVQDDAQ